MSFACTELTGGFWKDRQKLVQSRTIDAVYNRFEESGRFEALKMQWKEGQPDKPHIFWESDATKWIEGASYFLQQHRDADLEAKIDELIGRMAETQEKSGYLNVYFTVVEPDARFTRRTDHELYCCGHLIEAAVAYAQATGKTKLLEVACRYADLVDRVFRQEHSAAFDTPGHPEIELALFKLADYKGETRYQKLAEYFVETRGRSSRDKSYEGFDLEHMQSHLPVREQDTAQGHSVRAVYLYSAMADEARENHDEELFAVCRGLYDNITRRRMYITGGIGSTHLGESFTYDYDLPEYTAYAETCASIGLALFCRRMWLLDDDGSYADTAEQTLYNTVLGGLSLSGDRFFYENPLSADVKKYDFYASRPRGLTTHLPILERKKVFDCSCCPPNLIRIVGSVADFMYSTKENTVFAQCYMSGHTQLELNGQTILLEQKTGYPYDGAIDLCLREGAAFTLAMRIPGWCHSYTLTVETPGQGTEEIRTAPEKGFVYLTRNFPAGSRIRLSLDMGARIVQANPLVTEVCGRAAICRGPLVYCAEAADNAFPLRDVRLSRTAGFTESPIEIGGWQLPALTTDAKIRAVTDALYTDMPSQEETVSLRLIPYFAWANRGKNDMTTWFLL